jgi:NADPH2:quinone reductase
MLQQEGTIQVREKILPPPDQSGWNTERPKPLSVRSLNNVFMTARKLRGPSSIRQAREELAMPGSKEVIVKIAAVGLSFAELMLCEHLHGGSLLRPSRLGYEFAGTVVRCGAKVTEVRAGQRVTAVLGIHEPGACATYLKIAAARLLPIPDGVAMQTAAAFAINYLTAYQILHRIVRVRPGEKILVHGAAGGVGTALLELGRLAGLEMYGTASAAKHDVLRSYGATPIDYQTEDFVERIKSLTGEGVDIVVDAIGGRTARRSLATLAPFGRLVIYGFSSIMPQGRLKIGAFLREFIAMPRFTPLSMLQQGQSRAVMPYVLNTYSRQDWYKEDMQRLLKLLAMGQIKPLIACTLPFTKVAQAHHMLAARTVAGKIVLSVNDEQPRVRRQLRYAH